jgi:hypothetical protein
LIKTEIEAEQQMALLLKKNGANMSCACSDNLDVAKEAIRVLNH